MAAPQAPPSLGFSRQEHWSGLPFPSPMHQSEVAQSCPTLCDPMDCSLPGSSVHGIFQAKILEWDAIAFSDIFIYLIYKKMYIYTHIYKRHIKRYIHLNALFQRIARRDKKAFLSEQGKEIEENNRIGKTRDHFKKIRTTKGTFHAKMGTIRHRNCIDLTEAENMKRRWQE